jgi:APA family basic amino acid/polyamine antiporter
MKSLFVKKSVNAQTHHFLKRTLTTWHLIGLGVGAMIGAGLFVLTGAAAAFNAGPAVIISFVITAILCAFISLCYAELTAMIPISGSAYSYVYVAMGEFPAWIVGWALTMGYLVAACSVAVGWSGYFTSLLQDFQIQVPIWMAAAPIDFDSGNKLQFTKSFLDLPALVITGLAGWMLVGGVKGTAKVNTVLVIIKLGIIVLFVACGIFSIKAANLTPFIPPNTGTFGEFGVSGIFRGATIVFFAFLGFDVLATLAQEAHNPQKSVPRGMFGSLLICTIAYILVSIVLVGVVPYVQLGVANPIAVAVNALGPTFWWLRILIKVAILAGLFSVIITMLLGQSRIFYMMARDGLLPHKFATVSEKSHVPVFGTLVLTAVGMLISTFFPISLLGQVTSMSLLLAFGIVCIGVLVLRYSQPNLERPFKVRCLPVVSILGALICFMQMCVLPPLLWIQLAIWLIIGCIIYFGYSIRHSKIRHPD